MADIDHQANADVAEEIREEEVQLCLFSIDEDYYAIPVSMLTEIIIPQKIFPVPTTPSHVLGVMNLRGSIVPIVDIRPVLALPGKSLQGQIAIIKHGNVMLGIIVDNVSEVVSVPDSRLLAVPAESIAQAGGRGRSRFVRGMIQRERGVAALLDIEKVFDEIKLA